MPPRVSRQRHVRDTTPQVKALADAKLKMTIESIFATVRLRTKITKGQGSKAAALAMAFKLIESAQRRWRMVDAPHLVAPVRAGASFVNGKLAERAGEHEPAAVHSQEAAEEAIAEAA